MKWGLRVLGGLALVLMLALGALALVSEARVAGWVTSRLAQATGRDVRITGDVDLSFWPVLGIRADGLEIDNADWAQEGAMLSAAKASIGLKPLALLRGETRITHIDAMSPTIRLEHRKDGRASWHFSDAKGGAAVEAGPAKGGSPRPLSIDQLSITNATLIYDAEGAQTVTLDGVDLTMAWPDPAGAADISATYRPAGHPVRLSGTIETFDRFLAGELTPLNMQLSAKGGEAALKGRGALKGAVAGHAQVSTGDTAQFLRSLGLNTGELPAGLGRKLALKAQMTLTPDRQLALRDIDADLDGNRLRGTADVTLREVPHLRAKLEADTLRLSEAAEAGKKRKAAAPAAKTGGWSQDPIDASALALFNGQIDLEAKAITLGQLHLGQSRLSLRNDRSRMVFALQDVAAYDGQVTGEFVMNNREGLSVGGSLSAKGVEMNPLLSDLADVTRFTGQGAATLSFLGVGNSVSEIMQSLSGQGKIDMGRGTIEGIDLDNLLGSYDVAGGSTVFDAARATFEIDEGVLRNDDLTMTLPRFMATGAGSVSLGERRLDYTVTPQKRRADGGRGVAVPVRIVGPWDAPRIKPDLRATIDLNAGDAGQRKGTAKRELEEAIDRELGRNRTREPQPERVPQPQPERQPTRSLEDILLEQVEDALKRELLKIFD